MLLKIVGLTLLVCLLATTSVQAQSPGGPGGSAGGHGHGGRGGRPQGNSDAPRGPPAAPVSDPTPVDQFGIVGVVQAIDPVAGRVTIAYEAVAARNWPPGTMPFVVNHPSLLADLTVGEKVRFMLESEQITQIGAFVPGPGGDDASHTTFRRARGSY